MPVRKLSEPIYDGTTGAQTGENVVYQLGEDVDGVFVPFVTKSGGYIDALVKREKDEQAANTPTDVVPSKPATPLDTGLPQSPAVPTEPNAEGTGQ